MDNSAGEFLAVTVRSTRIAIKDHIPLRGHQRHLVEKGEQPACVSACPTGVFVFGDLNDPKSEIAKKVASMPVQVLKYEMGNRPQAYYIELDLEVVRTIGAGHHSE